MGCSNGEDEAVANQWGRESRAQSATSGGRGLSFFAVFIAFALGLAGGYGVLRMVSPDNGAAIEAARKTAADLESENRALKDDLAALRSAPAGAKTATDAGQAEIDALGKQLADANAKYVAAAATIERQAAEIGKLEKQRDALMDSATAGDSRLSAELARLRDDVVPEIAAERDRLTRETADLKDRIEGLTGEIAALSADKAAGAEQIAALQGRLEETQGRLADAQKALADGTAQAPRAAAPAATSTGTGDAAAPQASDAASPIPRDPQAVEDALRNAPGLDRLSEQDRQKLKTALVNGECVTSALESVFDDVPILALRNLIRDLNSGC